MKIPMADRVVELLEEERKRLAREIHDGPAQSLTNVAMRLEVVKRLTSSGRIAEAIQELERLQSFLRSSINDSRRMIFDLRPTFLENGVHDAIRFYAAHFSQTFGISVVVEGDWSTLVLPHAAEVTLFRVYQEALHNVYKHAEASAISVRLEADSVFRMIVRDDGRGFNTSKQGGSYGLQGMKERMALIHGTVRIESVPGQGTQVICEVLPGNE